MDIMIPWRSRLWLSNSFAINLTPKAYKKLYELFSVYIPILLSYKDWMVLKRFLSKAKSHQIEYCINILDYIINLSSYPYRSDPRLFNEAKELKHKLYMRLYNFGRIPESRCTSFAANALNTWNMRDYLEVSTPKNKHLIKQIDLTNSSDGIGILGLIDYVLRARKMGEIAHKDLTIYSNPNTANDYFLKLINQMVPVKYTSPQNHSETNFDHFIYYKNRWMFWAEALSEVYRDWEGGPLLSMPNEDREVGFHYLKKHGFTNKDWFVCLHVREAASKNEDDMSGPHNADIYTYIPAIEYIISKGGWVVRIGDDKMKPLSGVNKVIDYAHEINKNPLLDIFFIENCKFFIGTASGPSIVAHAFNKRSLLTNFQPLIARPPNKFDIFLPKLYKKNGKYVTFKDVLNSNLGYVFNNSEIYRYNGVEIIDNTEEEICSAVMEMFTDGPITKTSPQKEYDQLFNKVAYFGVGGSISNSFIDKYRGLLYGDIY